MLPEVELEHYAVVTSLLDLQTSLENGGSDPRVESLGLLSARLCFSQMAFTDSPSAPQTLGSALPRQESTALVLEKTGQAVFS